MDKKIQAKVAQFFNKYPARAWSPGQMLLQAHDTPAGVYYLEKGSVKQYTIDYRGEEVVVNVFHSPSFFPMSWALNDTINEYYYDTTAETLLRCAPSQDVREFIDQNHDVAVDLLQRVYSGLDGVLMRMVHLMSSSAYVRVLYELIVQTKRLKINDTTEVTLPIKEVEIGTYCGLARETVSREFKKLKSKGLVTVIKRQIVITDLALLEAEHDRQR